jgi:hypothetical protein
MPLEEYRRPFCASLLLPVLLTWVESSPKGSSSVFFLVYRCFLLFNDSIPIAQPESRGEVRHRGIFFPQSMRSAALQQRACY